MVDLARESTYWRERRRPVVGDGGGARGPWGLREKGWPARRGSGVGDGDFMLPEPEPAGYKLDLGVDFHQYTKELHANPVIRCRINL